MEEVAKLKRTWNLAPVFQIVQKISCKLLPLFVFINWPSLVSQWVLVQKIYSKVCPVSCTNTHHDVTDLVNNGMLKNTKTWISWEWNITFLRNEKVINMCLRWHILRSYSFVAEVTFNNLQIKTDSMTNFVFIFMRGCNIFQIKMKENWGYWKLFFW